MSKPKKYFTEEERKLAHRKRNKKYRMNNKISLNQRKKEYYQNNKEKAKEYQENHKKERNIYLNNRRRIDIDFKIAYYLRNRLRIAIYNDQKKGSAVRDLGCSIPELKVYLESKFQEGMSWENWSFTGWHIDHIKPLSSFNLSNREEFLKANHYTNLQPLWAEENLSKYNKQD